MEDCIASHSKRNIHLFSALIKAMNRPSQLAQLFLLDIYQRTKAATDEEIVQTANPDNIRTILADIYGNI